MSSLRFVASAVVSIAILALLPAQSALNAQVENAQLFSEQYMEAHADAGEKEAQLHLAKAYLTGSVVPRDRLMAYFWFNVAATGNTLSALAKESPSVDEARAERDKLEKLLTPAQIAQAEAMSREWKPKNVVGSDSLKAMFRTIFRQVAYLDDPPYKFIREKEIDDHTWETRYRFPGRNSERCSVSVFQPTTPEMAQDMKDAGIADRGSLACMIFSTSDIEEARSTYESVGRYIWELLPDTWMRHPDRIPNLTAIEELNFWSDLPRTKEEGEKGTHIRLSINKAGGDFSLLLSFSQKSPCWECSESDRKSSAGARDARTQKDLAGGTIQTSTGAGVNGTIGSQIDELVKSGRFATLPPARSIAVGGSQQPGLSIKNQTAYELTVLLAGPVERSFSIPQGGSQIIALPAGTYRVLGRVTPSDVLPFYGTQIYASGNSYEEAFYVK